MALKNAKTLTQSACDLFAFANVQRLCDVRIPFRLLSVVIILLFFHSGLSARGSANERTSTLVASSVHPPTSILKASLSEAKQFYREGNYIACLEACEEPVASGIWNEEWYRLKTRVELTLGRYESAAETLALGLDKYSSSIYLRLIGYEVLRMNNRPQEAEELLLSIDQAIEDYPWRFSDARNRVVRGRYLQLTGGDPRDILVSFYDKAKDQSPRLVDPYVATAELALEKFDFAVASRELARAVELDGDEPYIHYLLARAYASSDSAKSEEELARTLELNPNFPQALLWLVDSAIEREQYQLAEEHLSLVESTNADLPELWAYRAVLAHLAGDFEQEQAYRERALRPFATNPEVDHLIGTELSQKYRFAEGAAAQRRALQFDANHLAARFQLSQDLLRLGEEEEGWNLAAEVNAQDTYNVVAHNLVTLRDRIDSFVTLEREGIRIRMSELEAELYGQRALSLMIEAKQQLAPRYETPVEAPIIIEIFPEQKDFAIRTFGLPGGQGFLGVCFGRVITANSPASLGSHPSNWEATLWHEFCHAVTLEKTSNRMPRWLSEGISVYEERRRGPGWGQTMNTQYRRMIIEGELFPVSDLSAAFLRPKSAIHLQFAYFQSSLVVEYIIQQSGLETLQAILTDLGVGMPINEAIERHIGSLEVVNAQFEQYARELADNLAKEADWSEANLARSASLSQIDDWLTEHPNNLAAMRMKAALLMQQQSFEAASDTLEQLIALYEGKVDRQQDYVTLASAYRQLEDVGQEKRVLDHFVANVSNSVDAHRRLLEIAQQQEDWEEAYQQAQRLLAIDPLQRLPHEATAEACEQLGRTDEAIIACRAILTFRNSDIADIQYRLAKLYLEKQELALAHQAILQCLVEAPRYREAYQLYREIASALDRQPAVEQQTLQSSAR